MDPALERRHLEEIDQLIAAALGRIARQQQHIATLEAAGHSTRLAEATLEGMQATLHTLQGTRATINDSLRRIA